MLRCGGIVARCLNLTPSCRRLWPTAHEACEDSSGCRSTRSGASEHCRSGTTAAAGTGAGSQPLAASGHAGQTWKPCCT
eukprot:6187267-Pleurochrysis_carterae.AAC.1